jgi:hypothetical protein
VPKKKRVRRPSEDLKQELKDQVALLQNACDSFDKGLDAIGTIKANRDLYLNS